MEKYNDIIYSARPDHEGRPLMPMNERAKIFLPFAALKGYEEAIELSRLKTEERYENELEKDPIVPDVRGVEEGGVQRNTPFDSMGEF